MNGVPARSTAAFAGLWKRAASALWHRSKISDLQIRILEEELEKAQRKTKKLGAENTLLMKKLEASAAPPFALEASTGVKISPMNEAKRVMPVAPSLKKRPPISWWKDSTRLLHAHRGEVSVRAVCGHRSVEWAAQQESVPEYTLKVCASCWDLVVEPKPMTWQAAGGTELARRLYGGILAGYANEGDLLDAFVEIQIEAFSDGLQQGAIIAALTEGRLNGESARENNIGLATRHAHRAAGAHQVQLEIQRRIDEANEVQK